MSRKMSQAVSCIFFEEAPSSMNAVLDKEPQDREDFFGDGEMSYHISEPPPYHESDDIKLDDHGDPYVDWNL